MKLTLSIRTQPSGKSDADKQEFSLPTFDIVEIPGATITSFGTVTFDGSQPLTQHISDSGAEVAGVATIAKHFLCECDGPARKEVSLLHFGKDMQLAEVTSVIESLGQQYQYQEGGAVGLLSFGSKYCKEYDGSEEQLVMALGAAGLMNGGASCILMISASRGQQRLQWRIKGPGYSGKCKFLLSRDMPDFRGVPA